MHWLALRFALDATECEARKLIFTEAYFSLAQRLTPQETIFLL
jgi:hypothetical protein